MGLRFDPVGGGQFKQAVQQMIEAESQPIKTLNATKSKEDARLKLFQEFKTKFMGADKALNELSSFRKFRELKADLGDGTNVASVTLDKERAEVGQYQIQVDELASRTSAISNGFENADDPILGIGFITMNPPGGEPIELYVDDKNSSLRGIASLINITPSTPVKASVIKDVSDADTPWKLLLTGKKEGVGNQIDFPDFYFMDGDQDISLDDTKDAKNAQIQIDGFPIESESNDIPDFLTGVALHIKQARPDQPFTLTISEDFQKIGGKVKSIIDQLNQILQFITKQNSVDDKTDTSTMFTGDTSLQAMEYRIRNVVQQGFPAFDPQTGKAVMANVSQFGIEFDKMGQITFKEEKFNKEVEKNFDFSAEVLTGPNGFANKIRDILSTYTRSGNGMLATKEQAIRGRIKQIDSQIEQKTRYFERRKQDITDQFSRLEGTLGNLQRQQQYLSAALPGAGGGGSMISQLLGG